MSTLSLVCFRQDLVFAVAQRGQQMPVCRWVPEGPGRAEWQNTGLPS